MTANTLTLVSFGFQMAGMSTGRTRAHRLLSVLDAWPALAMQCACRVSTPGAHRACNGHRHRQNTRHGRRDVAAHSILRTHRVTFAGCRAGYVSAPCITHTCCLPLMRTRSGTAGKGKGHKQPATPADREVQHARTHTHTHTHMWYDTHNRSAALVQLQLGG